MDQETNDNKIFHHPGQSQFLNNDYLWTCCNQHSENIEEFLKIPGCSEIQILSNHLQQELPFTPLATSTPKRMSYPKLPLPSFSENNIDTYFVSIEYWFKGSGIFDEEHKFNIVMSQVPITKLTELKTILSAVPDSNKYTYIKSRLIDYFSISQQEKLRKILSEMTLGDQRPSNLYHQMARLASNVLPETTLLNLWLSKLPAYCQSAIIGSTASLDDKLRTANAIQESIHMQEHPIAAINSQPAVQNSQMDELTQLFRKFEQLLSNNLNQNSRARSISRKRSSSSSRPNNNPSQNNERREDTSIDQFSDCWYHRTFGNKSNKCKSPCNFKKTS